MIKAYFDGACEPNGDGGKMAYGGVIYRHEKKIHEISYLYNRKDNIASNNIAEYCGLIAVFKYLLQKHWQKEEIYIFGDSKMVINQMKGEWTTRHGKYLPYYEIAIKLLNEFSRFPHFEWIPKERNTEADLLSRRHYG